MRKTVKILGLSALVGALAFGSAAIARGPGPGGPGGPDAHVKQLLKQLDLDEEQKALAKELQADNRATHMELASQKSELADIVIAELGEEEPNRRAIHGAIDDGLELMGEALHSRADALLELQATFSPEQRATLVEELEDMQERRAEMMERRGERQEQRLDEGL